MKVVVFGAGLVAGAHVRYLLEHGLSVTVASRTLSKAQELVGGHSHGQALACDVEREGDQRLEDIVAQHDLAVSLLPYVFHPRVARACVKHAKHMVTTSYVKDEMRALDQAAKQAGVTLLNEIGVDPGIDHMTAMRVIHRVQRGGGEITRFMSYCGGLPAPEANTNPYGYKFSWSPRGVLMAGKNAARYRQGGQVVEIPGPELFDHHWRVPVEIEGKMVELEGYPNRDSLPYADAYSIRTAQTMFRGTLRYPGWSATLKAFVALGLLDEAERNLAGLSCAEFVASLMGKSGKATRADLAAHLGLAPDSFVLDRLEWLGLLSDEALPVGVACPLDVTTATMLAKMRYAPGERDMLVLQHEFLAEYAEQSRKEKIVSTMIDFGIPGGDTSMNRTVGLPAAIGARLILEGVIQSRGVLVPVTPEIYVPVLEELERLGIHFSEKTETLGLVHES